MQRPKRQLNPAVILSLTTLFLIPSLTTSFLTLTPTATNRRRRRFRNSAVPW